MKVSALFLMIGVMLSGVSKADEIEGNSLWLTSGFASRHIMTARKYRENNTGIGAEYSLSKETSLVAGIYRNSFDMDSRYAGVSYRPFEFKGFRGGVTITALSGYNCYNNGNPFLTIVPSMGYEYKRIGANFVYMPMIENGNFKNVFAFQLKVKLL